MAGSYIIRDPATTPARKQCSRRHALTDENTYVAPNGYKQCLECRNLRNAQWYREHGAPDVMTPAGRLERRKRTLKKYGLTVDGYAALLAEQSGLCAICHTAEPGGKWGTSFHVDHDHQTGAVRGLLCGNCNVMLGNAKDDPDRLRAGAEYLENS